MLRSRQQIEQLVDAAECKWAGRIVPIGQRNSKNGCTGWVVWDVAAQQGLVRAVPTANRFPPSSEMVAPFAELLGLRADDPSVVQFCANFVYLNDNNQVPEALRYVREWMGSHFAMAV